ncbi:MAG: electron transfer flavoprotein subunit beta/FixA family protein [Candidatus Eremiobacteraeota bacterium]|nr:electron transfer flavoprotein subunit beta/FixA family protein [Candidatus Eremiobacteraeota bacterium]MBV8281500.1 electron transfer flavoprotein subunit beta/FixA family protein [Candidatus Eremiobacteraeota bacterium]
MKIVVTVKQVPDTNAEKTFDPATGRLNRTTIENVLNPFDEYAIEEALRIKEAQGADTTVTILTMAPPTATDVVRKALGMGADNAVLLSDDAIGGSDAMATAYVLAQTLKNIGFDLVLSGTQSTDAICSVVPAAVAEHLGVPCLTYVKKLTIADGAVEAQRETETGYLRVRAPLPALVSVTKAINEPRYPTLKGIMGAKKKEIKTPTLAEIGAEAGKLGEAGSKTVMESYAAVGARQKGQVISVSDPKEGAKQILDFLIAKKVV